MIVEVVKKEKKDEYSNEKYFGEKDCTYQYFLD